MSLLWTPAFSAGGQLAQKPQAAAKTLPRMTDVPHGTSASVEAFQLKSTVGAAYGKQKAGPRKGPAFLCGWKLMH
jgi:hypothetical protein